MWTIRRVLGKVDLATIFIMETELWPKLFRAAHNKCTPSVWLNGRISDQSFGPYKRNRPFISRVLNNLWLGIIQNEQDATRTREFGLADDCIATVGNLKFDRAGIA